jgi:hypothetical protein
MATFEQTLTIDKRIVQIRIDADAQVYFLGHGVEVESGIPMSEVSGYVTDTLTTNQKRAVNDLLAAGQAWVDAQEHVIIGEG